MFKLPAQRLSDCSSEGLFVCGRMYTWPTHPSDLTHFSCRPSVISVHKRPCDRSHSQTSMQAFLCSTRLFELLRLGEFAGFCWCWALVLLWVWTRRVLLPLRSSGCKHSPCRPPLRSKVSHFNPAPLPPSSRSMVSISHFPSSAWILENINF